MIFIGDIAFTGILSEEPAKNPERFKHITPILKKTDIVFANLEVPVKVGEIVNEQKKIIHYSLPEPTEQLLKLLNIGCVSLANNHIYDCKMDGLKATIGVLDRLGIYHTGAGWRNEHTEPVIIEQNGYRIGFLAYVDKSTNPKTEYFPELLINYLDIDKVKSDIKSIKAKVDKIICSIHWGVDYSFYPTLKQRVLARSFIDAGADILMGHHPHTLQPYEIYNSGHLFYSLGGLTFGDYQKPGDKNLHAIYRKTKKGIIAKYVPENNAFSFISTHEKKGNIVKIIRRDYKKWSQRMWMLFRIKHSSVITFNVFFLKEKILDRVYEYFFGYYQNPFKRLFQFSNIRKIPRLLK